MIAALSISACFGVSLMKRRISFLQMNLATRGWLAMRSRMSRPSFIAGCSGLRNRPSTNFGPASCQAWR